MSSFLHLHISRCSALNALLGLMYFWLTLG
jgi:hypothetical protein